MQLFQQNNLDSFQFPALEELEELDTRFDGKVGKFKLGDSGFLAGNSISFLFLSQACCFGNIGKLIKDTIFYSTIIYATDGAFGSRLIRLFLKGDNLQNWKNSIEKLFYMGVNPYECSFDFEITGKVKGEHSVFVLNVSEERNKQSVNLSQQLAASVPNIDYFNNLPFLDSARHDALVLWQYKQVFNNETEDVRLIKHFKYGEAAYEECLRQDRARRLDKVVSLRSANNQLSSAQAIARKYLIAGA